MHQFIEIFGLDLGAWGLMLMLGVISSLVLFKLLCTQDGVPQKAYAMYGVIGFVSALVGILFAYLFDNFYKFFDNYQWGLGGFTLMGGVLGGVGAFVIATITFTNSQYAPYAWGIGLGLVGIGAGIVLLTNPINIVVGAIIGGIVLASIGVVIGLWFKKSTLLPTGLLVNSYHPEYRATLWPIVNKGVICITLAVAIGRIGCFMAGCCYGNEVHEHDFWHFLGVEFNYTAPANTTVLPTNLIESIFMFALFAIMLLTRKKIKNQVLLFGIAYSVFRFLIEYLRNDDRGTPVLGMSPSQIQSIAFIIIAVAITIYIRYKENKLLDITPTTAKTNIE